MNIEQGLDFILSHFETGFPRKISTMATGGKQVLVDSKEEALEFFKKANYVDCRIAAFGDHEIENELPNLIFVDLDDKTAINETRALFYKEIKAIPTILSTGNGFHLIQPINMISLKNQRHLGKIVEEPAKKFLLFAERYLTNMKCDMANHPSLRSCLLRIPSSYNSKSPNTQVTVIQEWNGIRADVRNLPFKTYLQSLDQTYTTRSAYTRSGTIQYIENLLRHKVSEGRKRICALVLCLYFANVRQVPLEEATKTIFEYFDGHISNSTISYKLKEVRRKNILPYSLKKMREGDPELYEIVTSFVGWHMSKNGFA